MARHGITYLEVVNVIQQLLGESQNPTIENVRKVTGTGSNATIAEHIRRWKQSRNEEAITSQQALPDELQALVSGLWNRTIALSADKFTLIEMR